MAEPKRERNVQTRLQLFAFLQAQMQTAYRSLLTSQRLEFESTLIKSYIIEIDCPPNLTAQLDNRKAWIEFINQIFTPINSVETTLIVSDKEEEGFYELNLTHRTKRVLIYLDCATDARFWLIYTLSDTRTLDWWLEALLSGRFILQSLYLMVS